MRTPIRCHILLTLSAFLCPLLPPAVEANRVERILWNVIRFRQQAELLEDLTEAARIPLSTVDLRYDFFDYPLGNTMSASPGVQIGFSAEDFFYFEIPYVIANWDGASSRDGIGDAVLEYQRVLHVSEDEDARFAGLVLALDLTAPTGNQDRGIGEGAWVAFPALTGLLQLSEDFSVAPSVAYLHSFGTVRDRASSAGRSSDEAIRAKARQFLLSPNLLYTIGERGWFLLSPDYSYDFENNESTLDVRTGFGMQFSQEFGFNLQFSQHVAGTALINRSFSLIFTHFF